MIINIPIGAARLVVESAWMQQTADPGSLVGQVQQIYRQAAASQGREQWKRNVNPTADVIRIMLEGLNAARADVKVSASVRTKAGEFAEALEWRLERQIEAEKKAAAEEAALTAKLAAENRQWETERRETFSSVAIENRRGTMLRDVAEDYGLDYTDPRIKAALLAAFRQGVFNLQQAQEMMIHREPLTVPEDRLDDLKTTNAAVFAAARERKEAECPDTESA